MTSLPLHSLSVTLFFILFQTISEKAIYWKERFVAFKKRKYSYQYYTSFWKILEPTVRLHTNHMWGIIKRVLYSSHNYDITALPCLTISIPILYNSIKIRKKQNTESYIAWISIRSRHIHQSYTVLVLHLCVI
jgi:hypothetical protein